MTTFSHQENRQELFQLVEQIVQDREKLGAHPQDTATRTRLAAAEAELSKSFDAPEGFCWCDIVLGEARAMGKHSQSIDPGPFEVILEDAVKKAKAVRDLIQKFVEHVTWILILDRIVDELFQNAAAQKLMEDTAPEFLKVMNRLTINNLILSLCRTTEPAQTGTHSNLTVQQVVNSTCWDDCRKPRVKQIEKRCDSFHSELKGVRDKLLAHKDLEWIMKKNIRSCLSEDIHKKVKKVLEQLDCLIRLSYEQHGKVWGGPVRLGVEGDVHDFMKELVGARLFKKCLDDARMPHEMKRDLQSQKMVAIRKLAEAAKDARMD